MSDYRYKVDQLHPVEKATLEYFDYIVKHRAKVKSALLRMVSAGVFEDFEDDLLREFARRIMNHDISKFYDEFLPYRMNFYPVAEYDSKVLTDEENPYNQATIDKYFNIGWENHKRNNKHHWEMLNDVRPGDHPLYEREFRIFEMLCDWIAMANQFNQPIDEYYTKNRDMFTTFTDEDHGLIIETFRLLLKE